MKTIFEVISILLSERDEVNSRFKSLIKLNDFYLLYTIFKATLTLNILLILLLILISENAYSFLLGIPALLHIVIFLMFKNVLVNYTLKLGDQND